MVWKKAFYFRYLCSGSDQTSQFSRSSRISPVAVQQSKENKADSCLSTDLKKKQALIHFCYSSKCYLRILSVYPPPCTLGQSFTLLKHCLHFFHDFECCGIVYFCSSAGLHICISDCVSAAQLSGWDLSWNSQKAWSFLFTRLRKVLKIIRKDWSWKNHHLIIQSPFHAAHFTFTALPPQIPLLNLTFLHLSAAWDY